MSSPIIVALDFATREETLALAKQLDPTLCRIKIGSTLFTHYGPSIVDALQTLGFDVFLDLKYHDIPHQVGGSCLQAAKLGVWMITIHCAGGLAMMQAAREAIDQVAVRPLLVGVTVLTSLSREDLSSVGYQGDVIDNVLRLAKLAQSAELDGVVSSAIETHVLRHELGQDFVFVTPGIRLTEERIDDQKRIMTPAQALQAGSTYLVIGRAITQAPEPIVALQKIYEGSQVKK